MTLDEFTYILESFGTDKRQWPESERAACQQLLQSSPEAQALLSSFARLEASLDNVPQPVFPGLETRVLNQKLPDKQFDVFDRLFTWLLPETDSIKGLWRPAAAACLPLVFGIVVGNFYSFGYDTADDGFQYWDDELLMLSFNDYSESRP